MLCLYERCIPVAKWCCEEGHCGRVVRALTLMLKVWGSGTLVHGIFLYLS